MSKRSADTQLTKDGPVVDGSDGGGQMEGQPQRATVAQLANRRILRGRGSGRRPGAPSRPSASHSPVSQISQQSSQPPFGSLNPNTGNNTQQQASGFSFGQQPGGITQGFNQSNATNNLQSSQSASFPPFGNSTSTGFASTFTPSSTGFNFSLGQSTAVSNPFTAQNNTDYAGQLGGYQGSLFNLPPPASKEASMTPNPTPSKRMTPTPTEKDAKRAGREVERQKSLEPPQFAAHAPFTWPQGEPVIKDDRNIHYAWQTDQLSSTQQLPNANGKPNNQQQPSISSFSITQAQAQSIPSLFGQVNPQQGQSTSNVFGNNAPPVNPPSSSQPTPNIFGSLNPQQHTQQPASNTFGQSSVQPQQAANNIFGQNSLPPQKSTSNLFGQNSTQSQQAMSNMFGQNATQSQQPNAFVARTEDSMSTSPDNSPQKSAQKQPGPFAFLNAPAAPGQIDNALTRGQGSSLFERITKPSGASVIFTEDRRSSRQISDQENPEATQVQGGSLFSRISKPTSTSNLSLGEGQVSAQDIANKASTSDPYEILKSKPVYTGHPTSPTKSPPRPRPDAEPLPESNRKIAKPTISLPPSQDGQPATSHFFINLKLPPASSPTSTSILSPSKESAPGNSQNQESKGPGIDRSSSSSLTTTATKHSDGKGTSLSASGRVIGMPPPPPAGFTDDQKRELVTGYRLKALDVGMQKYIMKRQASQPELEMLFRFYREKKQAIIDAGGLPLKAMAGNKRKPTNESQREGAQGKRARLEAPLPQISKPKAQVTNGPTLKRDAPFDSRVSQSLSQKRKADENMDKDAGHRATDSAKRTRGDGQISYPSLPTSSNSQTSSIFKNILGGKDQAPASDTSRPTVNGSHETSASDLKASSATAGNSFQFKPSPTSPTTSPLAISNAPSKAAPTVSMLSPSKPATDSPTKSTFTSMIQPSFSTIANPFAIKSSSAPFASTIPTSSPNFASPFSYKSNVVENPASAVVKPPTFETGAPSNFLSQFGKAAEETAKKEKDKRKAEDFDSDEDDEAEWERKDAEEQRAKKQKLEEALKPRNAQSITGKGFVLGDDDTGKQKEKSAQRGGIILASTTAPPFKDSGTSIFTKQSATPGTVNSQNIFSHLSDMDSGAEGGKTGDADDEDDGSEGGSNYDEDKDGHVGAEDGDRNSSQQGDAFKIEKAAQFASKIPFGATNNRRSLSPETPTSEGQSLGRSLFDRISRDGSENVVRKVPSADEKKVENTKPSLFPSASDIFGQAPSSSLGSSILGQSSSAEPSLNILGSATVSKPSSNYFGQPSPSIPATNVAESSSPSQGDHTWKPDTPIKFGSSSNAPGVKVTSPTPSKAFFGGLFGSPPANAAKETPAKPPSETFSTTPAKSPSVGFGFAFGGPPKTAMSTLAPPSGAASNTTSRATSPGATTAGESANDSTADGEDEIIERHEQIDLTSGGPGEEDEDVLFEVKAKAMSFDSDKKTWFSKGVGLLRVLKHRETSKTRMLLRQEAIGKIVLNAALLSAMKYEYATNKSVKMAVASDNGKLVTWMIRVGKENDAQELANVLEENKSN